MSVTQITLTHMTLVLLFASLATFTLASPSFKSSEFVSNLKNPNLKNTNTEIQKVKTEVRDSESILNSPNMVKTKQNNDKYVIKNSEITLENINLIKEKIHPNTQIENNTILKQKLTFDEFVIEREKREANFTFPKKDTEIRSNLNSFQKVSSLHGTNSEVVERNGNISPQNSRKSMDLPQNDQPKSKPKRNRNPVYSDIHIGCPELQARRYITDGFCTSEKPIKEVVCTGNCLPIRQMDWYAEFVKTISRNKLRDWQCVEDIVKKKRVKLLCQDGTYRYYRIKVVKSCKCKKFTKIHNKTTTRRKKKRRRKRRRGSKTSAMRGS